jgi:hypothetical protein
MTADQKTERPLEIVFRPGHAVGMVYLRNPTGPGPEIEYLKQALPGVDVRVDPKVDYLLLRLPASTLREVTEFAARNKIARHEAVVMLVKSGIAGADMVERINLYRQAAMELDISDALAPIRARRGSRVQDARTNQ